MGFLYFLERIRIPVLNEFMLSVTELGGETAFLVIALILTWCVDKYSGYYVLSVGFLGTITGQFMKLLFRIPRPWILDDGFTILEQARAGASGYSFPSGHTISSVGTFGATARITQKRWLKYLCIAVAILVPFSRMYVGVHTPLDVSVGALIAASILFVLKPVILGGNKKAFPVLLGVMLVISAAFLCFVECDPFPENIDPDNMHSGLKNAYTMLGCILGMTIVYIVDSKWIHFPTNAVWWAQGLKVLLGFAITLAIKSGLKAPLEALLGEFVGRSVRYFLLVIVAGIVWPLSFRWFAKLGNRK